MQSVTHKWHLFVETGVVHQAQNEMCQIGPAHAGAGIHPHPTHAVIATGRLVCEARVVYSLNAKGQLALPLIGAMRDFAVAFTG